jgi:hypothetical protein
MIKGREGGLVLNTVMTLSAAKNHFSAIGQESSRSIFWPERLPATNDSGPRDELLNGASREVHPALAAIEDGTVCGGDQFTGFAQDPIGVGDQLDFPRPAVYGGDLPQHRFEAAAIGNRTVQVPHRVFQLPRL